MYSLNVVLVLFYSRRLFKDLLTQAIYSSALASEIFLSQLTRIPRMRPSELVFTLASKPLRSVDSKPVPILIKGKVHKGLNEGSCDAIVFHTTSPPISPTQNYIPYEKKKYVSFS